MQDINCSPEVAAEIKDLTSKLHELCEANAIPLVTAVILSRISEGNGFSIQKMLSVHINGSVGATDNTFIAAAEMLKMEYVPNEVIDSLVQMNNDTGCNCPSCQARRAANSASIH